MRIVGKIISYITAALIIGFSLFFIFIEGRTLFAGDWLLFENPINGFIRYFLRLIVAIFSLILSFSTYFMLSKKANEALRIYFYFAVLAFLVSSIVIASFSTNYIDILFFALPSLYSLGVLLFLLSNLLRRNPDNVNN